MICLFSNNYIGFAKKASRHKIQTRFYAIRIDWNKVM